MVIDVTLRDPAGGPAVQPTGCSNGYKARVYSASGDGFLRASAGLCRLVASCRAADLRARGGGRPVRTCSA